MSLPLKILVAVAGILLVPVGLCAQPTHSHRDEAPKEELYTLRYKPQVGTTLYDAETVVMHHLDNGMQFPITSHAQLAFKNIEIQIDKRMWTFDRYFTKLSTIDRDTVIREMGAINKVTRLEYSMLGQEVFHDVIDTVVLSEDAQFLSYFFRAPRMLLPLPEQKVTYGASWNEVELDTIPVPGGAFVYSTNCQYTFAGVADTLGGIAAIITADRKGTFTGNQQKEGEQRFQYKGPITGADTTYLNLLTGMVVLRISTASIPVKVDAGEGLTSSDVLDVRSVYTINNSNVRSSSPIHTN